MGSLEKRPTYSVPPRWDTFCPVYVGNAKEQLEKSVTRVFIPTCRSCVGRNLGPQRFRFLLSQERRGEGAGV